MLLDSLSSDQPRPFMQAVPETYEAAEAASGFIWRPPLFDEVLDESGKLKRFAYAAIQSFDDDPEIVVSDPFRRLEVTR